jgi:hypothetical protein
VHTREGIATLEYRLPAAVEEVLGEYVHARQIFHTFMEWAVAHDFESFPRHDLSHFIQDFSLQETDP